MKHKRTFSQWLTNRFLLIIRSEENFAEKKTFSFNYAKLIVFSLLFFGLVFTLSFYLITTLLSRWFDPRQLQLESNKKIIQLSAKVDSLLIEQNRKEEYIAGFKKMLTGDDHVTERESINKGAEKSQEHSLDYITPGDSLLRVKMENEYAGIPLTEAGYNLANIFFFPPVEGVVTKKFNILTGNLGVDVAVAKEEYIKAVAEGIVILAVYTADDGNIIILQHKNQLVSVYKNNTELFKKEGDYVQAGDLIGLLGDKNNKKELPLLHFELWLDNNPVNPENYIVF